MASSSLSSLPYDLLRAIHECLNVPDRRRFERAMGWGPTGIKKLAPPQIDLLALRQSYDMNVNDDDSLSIMFPAHILIPVKGCPGKSIEFWSYHISKSIIKCAVRAELLCVYMKFPPHYPTHKFTAYNEWGECSLMHYPDRPTPIPLHFWNVEICMKNGDAYIKEKIDLCPVIISPWTEQIGRRTTYKYKGLANPLHLKRKDWNQKYDEWYDAHGSG